MKPLKDCFWFRTLVIAFVSTLAAWGLAQFVAYNIFSTSAFTSTEKSTDFELSDLYQSAASRRAVSRLNSDIVVVGIDDQDRDGIAALLEAVSFMGARAIGLDLIFPFRRYGDDRLIESFNTDVPIVFAADVRYDQEKEAFVRYPGNWFDPLPGADFGAVNFPASHSQDVIRSYLPRFNTTDGPFRSFAFAVADAAGASLPPGEEKRMILYPSVEFTTLKAKDLVTSDGAPRMDAVGSISGRIVLVGTLNDPSDQHLTPVNPAMSGVLIHATILDNLLAGTAVRYIPRWLEVVLAWLLSFGLTAFMNIAKEKWSNVGNLAIRVLQVCMMYMLFVVGCRLFVRHNLYIDLSLALLMTGLGALAFDIIHGLRALYLKIRKR